MLGQGQLLGHAVLPEAHLGTHRGILLEIYHVIHLGIHLRIPLGIRLETHLETHLGTRLDAPQPAGLFHVSSQRTHLEILHELRR